MLFSPSLSDVHAWGLLFMQEDTLHDFACIIYPFLFIQGAQCELCDKLAVGNATNGGVCESCLLVCNSHSEICMENATRQILAPYDNYTLLDVVSGV